VKVGRTSYRRARRKGAPGTTQELKGGEKTTGQVIRLSRGVAAAGKVVDGATGEAVADAQVGFQPADPQDGGSLIVKSGKTGADGMFTVKGLREGNYMVSATAKGYLRSKATVLAIGADGARDLQLSLERGGSIGGRVLGEGDLPVVGATVRLGWTFSGGDDL
jgi:hypothetical protein